MTTHSSSHTSSYFTYPTSYGALTIAATDAGVCAVALGEARLSGTRASTALTNRAATQIQEYLAGKRQNFDVPLDLAAGTPFQRQVWEEVTRIPYGQTRTSAEIAAALGKPGAHRSVGAALKSSPCALLIPDHRIVSASGKPLGSGKTAELRSGFLALEARYSSTDEP